MKKRKEVERGARNEAKKKDQGEHGEEKGVEKDTTMEGKQGWYFTVSGN